MGLFAKKNYNFLGVDIGTSSIKIVQLANEKGRAKLITYGMFGVNADIIRNKTPETIKIIVQSLDKLISKARVSTKICSAALPTFSVFSSVISLPIMAKSDLASAVKWEAKKFIPFPIENMILDWKVLEREDKAKKNYHNDFKNIKRNSLNNKAGLLRVDGKPDEKNTKQGRKLNETRDFIKTKEKFNNILLTAAPKNLVSVYVDIFKRLGLSLFSLEVESFAMARSLISDERTCVMIVDIGSVTTDVCVTENSLPILNRSIEVGGNMMTKSIAKSLNISFERAEQFKQDFGLTISSEGGSNIPKTIEETLSPMVNEIKYVFDLYRRQGKGQIDKVILSGGSAYLPNLVNYLSKSLNSTVYIGDAWHKVMYPKELKSILDEIGPRFSVAVGLALRGIV